MAANKKINASVFTGDIINSSEMKPAEKRKMLKALATVLGAKNTILPDLKTEIFQGDSFQGVTADGMAQTLRYALIIMASLKKQNIEVRISIGIGEIDFAAKKVITSNGTAFQLSGRGLEEIKRKAGTFIGLFTKNEDMNFEFDVHCTALDYLIARCTPLQAEALVLALDDMTQVQIAGKLNLSQPTVQQRLQAAGWPVFKAVVNRFEQKFLNTN